MRSVSGKCFFGLVAAAIAWLAAAPAAWASVTINSGPPKFTNSPDASFSFTTNPPQGTECKIDAAPSYASCMSPYSVNGLAEGDHTFYVRTVGGTPGTPATYSWTVDFTPPDTTITSGPSGVSNANPPQFTFSSTEQGPFLCSLDGAPYQHCPSPDLLQGLSDGQHTLAVRAEDQAGNMDATPATRTWTLDTQAPAKPEVIIGPRLVRLAPGTRGFHPVARNASLHSTAAFQTQAALQVQWRQPVPQPSITFKVAFHTLKPATGDSSKFTLIKTAPKTRALAFSAVPGYEYCFKVTATDEAGNSSERQTCTTIPYKASKLIEGSFPGHSGSGYYLHQYAQSKIGGGYLELVLARPFKKGQPPPVYVKRVALIATKCPTCGKVEVILSPFEQPGSQNVKQPTAIDTILNLHAATTKKKQVIPLKTFATSGPTGNYKLFLFGEGGKPIIEGIGVATR
jgi:hypothetical protein